MTCTRGSVAPILPYTSRLWARRPASSSPRARLCGLQGAHRVLQLLLGPHLLVQGLCRRGAGEVPRRPRGLPGAHEQGIVADLGGDGGGDAVLGAGGDHACTAPAAGIVEALEVLPIEVVAGRTRRRSLLYREAEVVDASPQLCGHGAEGRGLPRLNAVVR